MAMDIKTIIQSSSKPENQNTRFSQNEDMGYFPAPSSNKPDTFEWHNKVPFSWKQIFWGATIPILFLLIGYGVDNLTVIKYRPWIAIPIIISVQIIFFMGLVLYSVLVCKKQGYWPLIRYRSLSSILIKFFKSFLLFLLVNFIIGITSYIIVTLLRLKIDEIEFVQIASYGPNSLVLILLLFFGFTISPIIEELFYRGFLYNALKTKTSILIATILQSAFFRNPQMRIG
jgi:membrane protease YdiL (CAAX protease family)